MAKKILRVVYFFVKSLQESYLLIVFCISYLHFLLKQKTKQPKLKRRSNGRASTTHRSPSLFERLSFYVKKHSIDAKCTIFESVTTKGAPSIFIVKHSKHSIQALEIFLDRLFFVKRKQRTTIKLRSFDTESNVVYQVWSQTIFGDCKVDNY